MHPHIIAPRISTGGPCPCCRCAEGAACTCHIREADFREALKYLDTTIIMLKANGLIHTASRIEQFTKRCSEYLNVRMQHA